MYFIGKVSGLLLIFIVVAGTVQFIANTLFGLHLTRLEADVYVLTGVIMGFFAADNRW